jgi:hypothetical protein
MATIIQARLKNGRKISSSCCIISTGDRGPLLFMPSERANRNFFRVAREDATKLFGDRPSILLPPHITKDGDGNPWLPPVRLVAEFSSAPISDGFDFSTAVIIWYQQSSFPFVGDDVRCDFECIPWESDAVDRSLS